MFCLLVPTVGLMGNKRRCRKRRVGSFCLSVCFTFALFFPHTGSLSCAAVPVPGATLLADQFLYLFILLKSFSNIVPKMTASTSMLWQRRSREPELPRSQKGRRRRKEPRKTTMSRTSTLLFLLFGQSAVLWNNSRCSLCAVRTTS